MVIKAIETAYRDYKMRSRTEARWAIFFDTLGLAWEYEKEGFDLGTAGWYLPDFWLPGLQMWCEIKGTEPGDAELRKLQALAEGQSCNVLLLIGEPGPPKECEEAGYAFWRWNYEARLFVGDWPNAEAIAAYSPLSRPRIEELAEFLQEKADAGLITGPVPTFDGTQATLMQLIDLDRQYYRGKWGKAHPIWRWGFVIDDLIWCQRGPGQIGLSSGGSNRLAEHATDALLAAYRAARGARFEYGEQPSTAPPAQPAAKPSAGWAATWQNIMAEAQAEARANMAAQPPDLAELLTEDLITELQARGVRLIDKGTTLRCEAPRGVLTDELRTILAARKQGILYSLRLAAQPKATHTIAQLHAQLLLDQPVGVLDGKLANIRILPAEEQGTRVRARLIDRTGSASLKVSDAVYAATAPLWVPGNKVLLTGRIVHHDGDFAGVILLSADQSRASQSTSAILEVLAVQPRRPADPQADLEVSDAGA